MVSFHCVKTINQSNRLELFVTEPHRLVHDLRREVIAEIRGEIMHDDPATPNNVAIRTNMNEWSAFTPSGRATLVCVKGLC